MNHYAMIAFLRYIQRVQLMVVQAQQEDPKFRDIFRAARLVYDLTYPPQKEKANVR